MSEQRAFVKYPAKNKRWIGGAMLTSAYLIPSLVMADSASDEYGGLEEVTVTAQFVKQNLQETPVSITAVTAAMLEARGQESVEQIAGQAPNVTLTTGGAFGGPSLIGFIRGVGQTDFNPAVEPGVGLYVDDVYYSTLTGSVLDLLDLDRLEVLRGPQGTLAGKNSIGGSIKLYSKKPGPDNDGYAEAGFGTYNAISIRAASNFTLIPDKLYARIAGVSRARDGYVTRLDYGCTHPGSGFASQVQGANCVLGHEGGIKYTAARAALRWLPTDNLEVNLAGDVVNDVSEPAANVISAVGPTTAPIFSAPGVFAWNFAPVPPTSGIGCQFIAYGSNSCDPNSPNNPYVNYSTYVDPRTGTSITPNQTIESRGVSMNIDWKLGGGLQLQSISAYRSYTSGFGNDADGTPVPVQQLYQTLKHSQKSQEFRFNGTAGSILDYTLGAFYFDQTTSESGRINLGYVGFDFLHGPDPVDATTWAVFAQGILHPTEKMDISLGVRYTDDQKKYTYARHNADFSTIQPCIGPPGTFGNPPNCLIASLDGVSSTFEGTRTDYRAALTYKWTDDFMTYAQVSTGFKGGGVNPRPFYGIQAFSFDPETTTAYELGAKSQLFNNSVRLNGALFFNKYKDIQESVNDCTAKVVSLGGDPGLGVPCLAIVNAGDADVKGAELELEWFPIEALQLDGSVSYLKFKFTRIDPAVAYDPVTNPNGLEPGDVTPFSPKKKASLGIQYAIDLGSAGSVTPRVDASYQDRIYTDASNTTDGAIDSYTLVNSSVTWRGADKDWQMAFEGKNLTDKLYYLNRVNAVSSGGGTTYATPGLPRTYMFTVKRSF